MVRSCSTNAARPDTQGCLEMGTTGKEKALQTQNNVEKDCRDGTEGIRIDMGAGATFREEQDGGGEISLRPAPCPRWGPKGLRRSTFLMNSATTFQKLQLLNNI